MWAVMMAGMMAPSALPFLMTFAAMARRRRARASPLLRTAAFAGGYFAVWTGFSALAAALQAGLQAALFLSPASMRLTAPLSGAVLMAAGVYQWTPFKDACVRLCRSPVGFLVSEWRDGAAGAGRMGLRHGLYCLGCCWLLMLLPFAVGVMSTGWMLAITAFVLAEKAFRGGEAMARWGGAALVIYGGWVIRSGGG
jgi:predicted metal-binding membrane protein